VTPESERTGGILDFVLLAEAARSAASGDRHTAYYAAASEGYVFLLVALLIAPSSGGDMVVLRTGPRGFLARVGWTLGSFAFMAFGFVIPLAILAGFISDAPDWRKLSFIAVTANAVWLGLAVGTEVSSLPSDDLTVEDAE
jgi:hypothetical protein